MGSVYPDYRDRLGGQAFNLEPADRALAFALDMHFGTIRQRQLWRTDEQTVIPINITVQNSWAFKIVMAEVIRACQLPPRLR